MTTQKKKPHGANYAVAGGLAALGGAGIVAGEHNGKIYDQIADGYEGKSKEPKTAEHTHLADKYSAWSRKTGPNYPYVTPEMREHAARQAAFHRAKAGRSSGGALGDRIGATIARSRAGEERLNGRVVGGALIATGALGAASVAYQRHKFDESKHRRNQGKFAPTGVKKSDDQKEHAVEKNLSAEEIFSKARENVSKFERETKAGAKWGAVTGAVTGAGKALAQHGTGNLEATAGVGALAGAAQGLAVGGGAGAAFASARKAKKVKKNLEQDSVVELFGKARGEDVSKALWNDAAEAASKLGGKVKTGATAAGTKVNTSTKPLQNWARKEAPKMPGRVKGMAGDRRVQFGAAAAGGGYLGARAGKNGTNG